jgi:long-subunit fatty acid transport protein
MNKQIYYLIIIMLCATPVLAQFGGLNAEFAGGGARALAMGGAFIGLADDATAVEFNPAGIRQLRRLEIAGQVIYSMDEHHDTLTGRSIIEGRGIFENNEDEYVIPSFLSFVYPTQNIVVGFSEFTNIYFDRAYHDEFRDWQSGSIIPVKVHEKVENYAYGASLAVQVFEQLNLGTTIRYNDFHYELDMDELGSDSLHDGAFSANFGLLWQANRFLNLGLVYKSPQKVEGEFWGNSIDTEIPDTLGFGVAVSPNDHWRFLFDVDHIWWSKFDSDSDDDIYRENVWRYHTGTEWYVGTWRNTALFLRSGYSYEESNALRTSDPDLETLFSNTDPVHHLSFGVGFAQPDYQIDLGIDLTEDKGNEIIASFVWYF